MGIYIKGQMGVFSKLNLEWVLSLSAGKLTDVENADDIINDNQLHYHPHICAA